MATLAAQQSTVLDGLTAALVSAAGGGDQAPIGPNRFLVVHNRSVAPITVTVATGAQVRGLAVADVIKAVPAAGFWFLPLSRVFADPTTGRAHITYSGVTTLDVGVVELAT